MKRKLMVAMLMTLVGVCSALAAPETVSVRVTDVTTSSCALVWMTDVAAEPTVEVYGDISMTMPISNGIVITSMPDVIPAVADAARRKGIMKVRAAGLIPNSRYFVRSVTRDPANLLNVRYSLPQEVNTAAAVRPYQSAEDGTLKGFANDLLAMNIYIRPADEADPLPGRGELLVLESSGASSPISAFVGTGAVSREGILDLNNLLGADLISLPVVGAERIIVHVYRGDSLTSLATLETRQPLATLDHYRRLPVPGGEVAVQTPVAGHYADINLDGKVDYLDFAEFRKQYKAGPNDSIYNSDYDFFHLATVNPLFPDPASRIDVQDFAAFAKEYGKTVAQ